MKKRIVNNYRNYYDIINEYITKNNMFFYQNYAFESISKENNEKRLIVKFEKAEEPYFDQIIYKWEEIEFFEKLKKFLRINEENENFIKIYEYFENKQEFVIVMDYYDNIDIKSFDIEDIRKLLIQLNQTFKIMITNKIPIRCFKIENVIVYKNKYMFNYFESIKLNQSLVRNFISTHAYKFAYFISPELKSKMIKNPNPIEEYNIYDKCGLWSLGMLIYILVYKKKPLFHDIYKVIDLKKSENKLKKPLRKYLFLPKTGNKDLDDLMQQLLNIEPDKRITWEKYFSHSFLNNH